MPAPALPFWLAVPALLFTLFVPGFVTLNLILLGFRGQRSEVRGQELGARGQELGALIENRKSKIENSSIQNLSSSERLFWTLALSLFLAGWLALTLAEFALFSIWAVLGGLLVWTLAAGGWLWRKGYRAAWWQSQFVLPDFKKLGLDAWVMLVVLTGAFGLFYLAPHETIAGSQDSGVYYATGANIARTGAILNYDPLLEGVWQASQNPQIGPKVIPQVLQGPAKQENRALFSKHLRLPGWFVPNNEDGLAAGQTVPQGFHLYPSYLALGYSLDGVRGESLVTPLFGFMAVFAVYLGCLRLFPTRRQRWIAPVATGLLALNSAQVWFSRESLWEALGEFLTYTAVYAFFLTFEGSGIRDQGSGTRDQRSEVRGQEQRDLIENRLSPHGGKSKIENPLALLGGLGVGLSFGLICLAHAQFPFLVWVLAPYFIWMRLSRRWGLPQWVMLIAFGLLFFQTVLHIRIFSLAYFEYTYHNVIIEARYRLNWYIPGGTVLLFALILIDSMPGRVRALEGWLVRHRAWFVGGLALIFLFYTFYSYFILVYNISVDQHSHFPDRHWSLSSYIGAPTTEGPERNLLRIGWYFSPVGMVLAFIGLAWLVWRRLDGRLGFFLALLSGISWLFLDTNYTQESYIYSLRRYLVVTVPAITIFIAYALFEAFPDFGQALVGLVTRRRRVVLAQAAGSGGPGMAFAMLSPGVAVPVAENETATTSTNKKGDPLWIRLLSWGLAGLLAFFMVWTGKTIYTLSEYGAGDGQPGLIAQFDDLATRFGPNDLLLFAGDRDPDGKVATPLTYIYGHPGFVLTDAVKNDEMAGLIAQWESQGYHVKALLGPNGGRFAPTGYELSFQSAFTIKLRQFESLTLQKPYGIQLNNLSYAIYDVHKIGANASFTASAGQGQPNSAGGWNLQVGQNDYAALVDGFYEAEQDKGGLAYRWTIQNGIMRVPCLVPDGVAGKLSVTLAGGVRPANKGPVTVSVYLSNYRYGDENGARVKLGQVQLGAEAKTYTFDIPAGNPQLSCARQNGTGSLNSLILWLSNEQPTTFVPAETGNSPDPRQLSFKVYGLNLSSK